MKIESPPKITPELTPNPNPGTGIETFLNFGGAGKSTHTPTQRTSKINTHNKWFED